MRIDEPTSCAIRGRADGDWKTHNHSQTLEVNTNIGNSITTVSKDFLMIDNMAKEQKPRPEGKGWIWNEEKGKWVKYRIRKLTSRECFRLMGVTDTDIDKIKASGVSESQQYKMAGNSIVVDVLYYIFTNMFINTEKPQDTLF